MKPFRLGVVILGAGASVRMGRPKLLLPWGDKTILAHSLIQWRAAGAAQIAVVTGPSPHPIYVALDQFGNAAADPIINPAPEQGMFSSIQTAAKWPNWREDLTHFAISLGDQPQIQEPTIRNLLHHAADHNKSICQPAFQGRARHPVIIPRPIFLELAHTDSPDLRHFLQHHAGIRSVIELNDPGLAIDLDTPTDYQTALKTFNPELP